MTLEGLDKGKALRDRLAAAIASHRIAKPMTWDQRDPSEVRRVLEALAERYGEIVDAIAAWVESLPALPKFYRDEHFSTLERASHSASSAIHGYLAQITKMVATEAEAKAMIRELLDSSDRRQLAREMTRLGAEMLRYAEFFAAMVSFPQTTMGRIHALLETLDRIEQVRDRPGLLDEHVTMLRRTAPRFHVVALPEPAPRQPVMEVLSV
jgi:hypothetical protein